MSPATEVRRRDSLYLKLGLALVALFALAGVGAFWLMTRTAQMHALEVQQQLSRGVAQAIVKNNHFFDGDQVDQKGLKGLFMKLMAVNPTLEVYLLDQSGVILGYDAPAEKILRERVDLAPVGEFLAQTEPGLIWGQDPRSRTQENIFSAWPIEVGGQKRGYIYAVLASEEYTSTAALLQASQFLRGSSRTVLAMTLLGAAAAVGILLVLTRHLRRLRLAINAFREGDRDSRAVVRSGDEIGALANDFNYLADTVQQQFLRIRKDDRLRREMVTNISHDLRTPVASLRGYLETCLAKEAGMSAEQRRNYMQAALQNTERLSRLIDDLFELAKLEAGDLQPTMESFPVAELVSDVVQKFQLNAQQKSIRLEAEIEQDGTQVTGDIAMLERVFDNLVENALRYTPDGGLIKIQVRKKGDGVEVKVADNGIGIPTEDLPRIFDRFYRVDKSRGEDPGGTGLGLAITKRILALHNSAIAVVSKPKVGTTFAFRLSI
jgi:two-component system, OmpR family, sensor kinase